MRRIVAILNPQADRGRSSQLATSLVNAIAGRFDLELLFTSRRGEAVDLARAAAERGCETVIAIGGDGTVHEVANGLMSLPNDLRPAMGVIPAGSGNDFAYAISVTNDLARSIEMIERGTMRTVDVGHVRTTDGRCRYFVNNIGMLLEGQINLLSHQLTWPKGSGLYLRAFFQSLLRRPPTAHLHLRLDGADIERDAAIISIGNGPRSGGKFFLLPEAKIDDGRLDYLLALPMSRCRLIREVWRSTTGRCRGGELTQRGQFSRMTINSNIELVAHVDGEPWLRPAEGVFEVELMVLPRALQVLCG